MEGSSALFILGFALVLLGIFIIVAATILAITKQTKSGKTKASGVIIIGPVPIIFGQDKKDVKTLLKFSTAFTIALIVMFVIYYVLWR